MPYQGPGKYRHYSGNVYDVIGEAVHTEDRDTVIVYRDGGGTMFVRPLVQFNKKVYVGNAIIGEDRFVKLT